MDGENRRVGRKVDGRLVQGFLWERALRPVAELDGAGAVVARFVYGERPNVAEYMSKGGRTSRLVEVHFGQLWDSHDGNGDGRSMGENLNPLPLRVRRRNFLRSVRLTMFAGRLLTSLVPLIGIATALASQRGYIPSALFWPVNAVWMTGMVMGTLGIALIPGRLAAANDLCCAHCSKTLRARDGSAFVKQGRCWRCGTRLR